MTKYIKLPRSSLIYRMVENLAPPQKNGIEDVHKAILDRLRRYSASSIADLALEILWNPPGDLAEEVRSAPWLTLLLVKWAMQDKHVSLRVGRQIPLEEFDQLRQDLWALQDRLAKQPNPLLMVRSVMHAQIEFQRKETLAFMRWPALYAKLAPGTKNRMQFREIMGIEPEAYIDLTYVLQTFVLNGQKFFGKDPLIHWRKTYGKDVDQIYSLFARDLPSLRHEMQTDTAQRIRGLQEVFEFPYLRRFPFLRSRDGGLHCWHRLVFARGIEDSVHLRLSSLKNNYTNEFSRVFEKYVTDLAIECKQPILDEASYKELLGGGAPTVEAIIEGDDCNIFIEAKMSLFADDILLQDSPIAIYNKTKIIRGAIKQGWKVGNLIRKPSSGFGTRFQVKQDYLIVVTSRELNLSNGKFLKQLYAPGVFEYPDAEAEHHLPLSNVFILSIEDYERTMGCLLKNEINFSHVLKEAVLSNQNAGMGRLHFSDFIRKYTTSWAVPQLIAEASRDSLKRIVEGLGGMQNELTNLS